MVQQCAAMYKIFQHAKARSFGTCILHKTMCQNCTSRTGTNDHVVKGLLASRIPLFRNSSRARGFRMFVSWHILAGQRKMTPAPGSNSSLPSEVTAPGITSRDRARCAALPALPTLPRASCGAARITTRGADGQHVHRLIGLGRSAHNCESGLIMFSKLACFFC